MFIDATKGSMKNKIKKKWVMKERNLLGVG
jgi:hypothetical protein